MVRQGQCVQEPRAPCRLCSSLGPAGGAAGSGHLWWPSSEDTAAAWRVPIPPISAWSRAVAWVLLPWLAALRGFWRSCGHGHGRLGGSGCHTCRSSHGAEVPGTVVGGVHKNSRCPWPSRICVARGDTHGQCFRVAHRLPRQQVHPAGAWPCRVETASWMASPGILCRASGARSRDCVQGAEGDSKPACGLDEASSHTVASTPRFPTARNSGVF